MSFLRIIWKNNSKHKKLCEELALAHSIRDFSENHDEIDDVSDEAISFSVKYIGAVQVESSRSEEATTSAVKKIISNQKGNNAAKKRVLLSISPKGIEVNDPVTAESLLQVSIYRISNCSADAAHSRVFSFIESAPSAKPTTDAGFSEVPEEGTLTCHAFLCQKRKMAQTVTLTVARSFERAYQIWQNHQFQLEQKRAQVGDKKRNENNCKKIVEDAQSERSLLIDLNTELVGCDTRDYLQNTWISFEDDYNDEFHQIAAQKLSMMDTHQWNNNIMCS